MEKVWLSGPVIGFRPHYSHGLGKHVSGFSEEEKELGKKGQWIASAQEANATYGADIFQGDMTVQPRTDKRLREHVEKAARMLVEKNVLKSTGSGFEAVKR